MKNSYISLVNQAQQLKAKHYKGITVDAFRYALIMLSSAYFVGLPLKKSPTVTLALQYPILNSLHLVFAHMNDSLRFSNEFYEALAAVFSLLSSFAIKSKLVEPVKPYNKEQPYNNKPDDKALNTKYFIPDSDDFKLSLSIEAKIYSDNDCNSKPK